MCGARSPEVASCETPHGSCTTIHNQVHDSFFWKSIQAMTTNSEQDRWSRVKGRLRSSVGDDVYSSWFARMDLESVQQESVRLSVPTTFLKSWIQAHYAERVTAEEIRTAAIRDGLWPVVPRIPLHVELKDYAQWYGKKKEEGTGPKGVLTYLAEELGNAIEQTVKVGTLKRALRGRRWVAVFDGLDEVPEDVKDKVAAEVTLFITQIALEESCDLFSLCTSRPQGYSGQFRDLDSATVDLLPLPTDRALALRSPGDLVPAVARGE